jgi:hypothetical protein
VLDTNLREDIPEEVWSFKGGWTDLGKPLIMALD